MKLIKETPKGDITVEECMDNHPGIMVKIGGKDVALIEYNPITGKHSAYLFTEHDEDFSAKEEYTPWIGAGQSTYMQGIIDDVQQTAESQDMELTDKQIMETANRVASSYSYSDYDEFILDWITEQY